jgi:hypothetical protein
LLIYRFQNKVACNALAIQITYSIYVPIQTTSQSNRTRMHSLLFLNQTSQKIPKNQNPKNKNRTNRQSQKEQNKTEQNQNRGEQNKREKSVEREKTKPKSK